MPLTEPIDIVYLWVDGQDARWRAKRRQALKNLSDPCSVAIAPFGNVEGRFRDNDELRYSLRALERFFRTTATFTSSPTGRYRPGCSALSG